MAISYTVIPRDQTSALVSYADLLITSGAIQYLRIVSHDDGSHGVPTNEFLILDLMVTAQMSNVIIDCNTLSGNTEIAELYTAVVGEQNVGGYDIDA